MANPTHTKAMVVAGTHSGCGKTTLSLGIMAALAARGLKVAPFKVGPDFIDPGHHAAITGVNSTNLDGWMLSREHNQGNFFRKASGFDVAVVEGVMGLFDGSCANSEDGSTAQMAKWLDLPVVLVVDAASMARSAAALVQGFEQFDPDLKFAGVIFNNLGSKAHLSYLEQALSTYTNMACLGAILRNEQLRIPERHLGLVTAQDHMIDAEMIDRLKFKIEEQIDLDALISKLPSILTSDNSQKTKTLKPNVRIGVARDRAFCFYYCENLELLEQQGAELVFFSPLQDTNLPQDLDGLYLGGGYPELHARRLSENKALRQAILEQSCRGMPIYGECGGFMYLCSRLTDVEANSYAMCGCFDFETKMQPKLRTLGYREITLTQNTILGDKGITARGHEFHYSDICTAENGASYRSVYKVTSRRTKEPLSQGYLNNKTLGSYVHLHFASQPQIPKHFTGSCRHYQQKRENQR
ncbi:MAG: cobyrinate a,c-diamide synthase [Desulfobacteraceae bacterium]|nr:cobyrinate a,c-diamide synthase [Desulfobacteraceae bacterium]